jgi:hypothetical protein
LHTKFSIQLFACLHHECEFLIGLRPRLLRISTLCSRAMSMGFIVEENPWLRMESPLSKVYLKTDPFGGIGRKVEVKVLLWELIGLQYCQGMELDQK